MSQRKKRRRRPRRRRRLFKCSLLAKTVRLFLFGCIYVYILCGTSTSTCRFIFIALVRSFALYLQKGPLLLNVHGVVVVAAAVDDDDDVDDDEKGKCTLKAAANFMCMLFIVMLGWFSMSFAKDKHFSVSSRTWSRWHKLSWFFLLCHRIDLALKSILVEEC